MTRTLVLLTLNEIDGVRALVPHLPKEVVDEVLAVDAGSSDGTREFLKANGIRVAVQERPGRGEAFRVAVQVSSGDHLVFFSPDGNEDPCDIPHLFDSLDAGADMVIGSRFLPGARNEEDEKLLPLRKWVNQTFTFIANMFWNRSPYITDCINGFRGITRDAFLDLAPQSIGYTIEYEMTIRAMKQGKKIIEIPTIEGQRLAGTTKGPSLQVGLSFLRFFLAELVRGDRR
ncbi:glycosyltransferase family 2 protein [Acidobacteria bacterium AH-259-D05]|nr:glycosyltransferase family 2 protein [Acidobacteria bacterium AH-259-D05]